MQVGKDAAPAKTIGWPLYNSLPRTTTTFPSLVLTLLIHGAVGVERGTKTTMLKLDMLFLPLWSWRTVPTLRRRWRRSWSCPWWLLDKWDSSSQTPRFAVCTAQRFRIGCPDCGRCIRNTQKVAQPLTSSRCQRDSSPNGKRSIHHFKRLLGHIGYKWRLITLPCGN